MALITVQEMTLAGMTPSYAAVAASDTFVPDERTFLHVKNAGAGADTVAIVTPGTAFDSIAIADAGGVVPITTGDKMFGPFPKQFFADPTTGLCTVTHSATASVTCALIRVPAL